MEKKPDVSISGACRPIVAVQYFLAPTAANYSNARVLERIERPHGSTANIIAMPFEV